MTFETNIPTGSGDDANAFVLLHRNDNVLICCRAVPTGLHVRIDGRDAILSQAIDIGHKIARVPLEAGDKVLRYGMPIGSMTAAAAIGDHVHTHNLKSDYISSHDRDAVHIEDRGQ